MRICRNAEGVHSQRKMRNPCFKLKKLLFIVVKICKSYANLYILFVFKRYALIM